jgi:hypothetical protein
MDNCIPTTWWFGRFLSAIVHVKHSMSQSLRRLKYYQPRLLNKHTRPNFETKWQHCQPNLLWYCSDSRQSTINNWHEASPLTINSKDNDMEPGTILATPCLLWQEEIDVEEEHSDTWKCSLKEITTHIHMIKLNAISACTRIRQTKSNNSKATNCFHAIKRKSPTMCVASGTLRPLISYSRGWWNMEKRWHTAFVKKHVNTALRCFTLQNYFPPTQSAQLSSWLSYKWADFFTIDPAGTRCTWSSLQEVFGSLSRDVK